MISKANYSYKRGISKIKALLKSKHAKAKFDQIWKEAPYAELHNQDFIKAKVAQLHPQTMRFIVTKVIDETPQIKTYQLKLQALKPVYFLEGQFLVVKLIIDDKTYLRPYSLSSTFSEAKQKIYSLTVQKIKQGLVSNYIFKNWKIGSEIITSGPVGQQTYSPLRDQKELICFAAGSGITPYRGFLARFAREAFVKKLQILYFFQNLEDECFHDFWKKHEKLAHFTYHSLPAHLVNNLETVLKEKLLFDQLSKNELNERTYFLTGSKHFVNPLKKLLLAYGISRKNLRFDHPYYSMEHSRHFPNQEIKLKVHLGDSITFIKTHSAFSLWQSLINDSQLNLENDKYRLANFNRALIIKGQVHLHEHGTYLRKADRLVNFVDTTLAFPLEDLELYLL